MRVTFDELVTITNRNTPRAQAGWFKKHFDINVEYDSNGVIITHDVFKAIVAKKYGVAISKEEKALAPRPQVKLLKSNSKEW